MLFLLPRTQILPGQELHEPPLKRSEPQPKPWPVATTTGRSKHRLYFATITISSKAVCVLGLWQHQRAHCPRVRLTSERWNSRMTLPCAFGLEDFYRQMRMCQEALRCCTTTDSNAGCFKEEEEEKMFL